MMISGTTIGFVCVIALLMAAILIAAIDKKEQAKGHGKRSRFFSRLALGLFITAFIGGVAMTLAGGIHPREESRIKMTGRPIPGDRTSLVGGGMPSGAPGMGAIGSVDQKEVKALEEKVAKDPKDVASRERLGHLYLQMQDFENVFRLANEAIRIDPKSSESRAHMGMVLFSMGKIDQAMSQFDQAIEANPEKATEALLYKGIVQFQGTNNLKGAKETWDRFLKIAKPNDPGIPRVKMFLDMINSQTEPQK